MRAITGAVVSSRPCSLTEAHKFLNDLCSAPDSYLASSDCAAYVLALDDAIREQHRFLRRCGPAQKQQSAADLDADGYQRKRERQGGEKDRGGGPHGFVEEAKVGFADGEKKSKKRKKVEEPRVDKSVVGIGSHIPASPEILSEQRGTKKGKHSSKELLSIVKQEPDLVLEEELGSEKKGKNKKEKVRVKLEEDVVEVKGQIVNNGVSDQGGTANREKERKKKKHSEEKGYLKGVKHNDKMSPDSDLNSERKKKDKKRGRGDDDVQEHGDHKKKKQRK